MSTFISHLHLGAHRQAKHEESVKLEKSEVSESKEEQNPLIGLQINQYQVEAELGRGGQAVVLAARDRNTDKQFALRIMQGIRLRHLDVAQAVTGSQRRLSLSGKVSFSALRTELAILRKIRHPNVVGFVEVLDFEACDSHVTGIAMAMDFIDGEVLVSDESLLAHDKLYWATEHREHRLLEDRLCRKYFCQVLAGLEYLHHNHIVHGDIKPSNIMVDPVREEVRLIDFGVSRLTDAATSGTSDAGLPAASQLACHGGGGRGSLLFFSPEAVRPFAKGNVYCGKAADVWAASLTLYALAFGHLPFKGVQSREGVLAELRSEEELFFTKHSFFHLARSKDAGADLLHKLLRKAPAHRASDIQDILADPWMRSVKQIHASRNAGLARKRTIRDSITSHDVDNVASAVTVLGHAWDGLSHAVEALEDTILGATERIATAAKRLSVHGMQQVEELRRELSGQAQEAHKQVKTGMSNVEATVRRVSHSIDSVGSFGSALASALHIHHENDDENDDGGCTPTDDEEEEEEEDDDDDHRRDDDSAEEA